MKLKWKSILQDTGAIDSISCEMQEYCKISHTDEFECRYEFLMTEIAEKHGVQIAFTEDDVYFYCKHLSIEQAQDMIKRAGG